MLPVEKAVDCIVECVEVMDTENVPLVDGLNRILATDVIASMDLPLFSHSTVDGFAIRCGDVEQASREKGVLLKVVETISAGSLARETVQPGLAIRVMTGAPLPPGANAVVREEETTLGANRTPFIRVEKTVAPMENVAPLGEDVRRGEVVLKKGTTLRPGSIGILASLDLRQVVVFRQPEVALLSTGNELVGLGESLETGRIFASSFYTFLAKLRECGCTPLALGVVGDDAADIEKRIRSGLAADAIITIGGTRRGNSDWVRDVYRRMDIPAKVNGVAMTPGGSFIFGLLKGKPVFSLPGSPTASIVAFEELVRPALLKMRGKIEHQGLSRPTIKMSLDGRTRGKSGVRKYVLARVVLQDGRLTVIPIGRKHRGALTPMIQFNGIVVLPEGGSEVRGGEEVNVRLVDLDL